MLLLMSRKFHIVGELSLAVGIFTHIAPSVHRHVFGQCGTILKALKQIFKGFLMPNHATYMAVERAHALEQRDLVFARHRVV